MRNDDGQEDSCHPLRRDGEVGGEGMESMYCHSNDGKACSIHVGNYLRESGTSYSRLRGSMAEWGLHIFKLMPFLRTCFQLSDRLRTNAD